MQCGCIWIVALLWKLPQMPLCSANNANLDKNNFDTFDKIDCCAVIHGRIWMNIVPNWSRIIMLSCTEISFVIYLSFFFWEIWSQTRVSSFLNSHCTMEPHYFVGYNKMLLQQGNLAVPSSLYLFIVLPHSCKTIFSVCINTYWQYISRSVPKMCIQNIASIFAWASCLSLGKICEHWGTANVTAFTCMLFDSSAAASSLCLESGLVKIRTASLGGSELLGHGFAVL